MLRRARQQQQTTAATAVAAAPVSSSSESKDAAADVVFVKVLKPKPCRVLLDSETTGFGALKSCIWSIAALAQPPPKTRLPVDVDARFECRLRTHGEWTVPANVCPLTDEQKAWHHSEEAPAPAVCLANLLTWLDDVRVGTGSTHILLVMHNAHFDTDFLLVAFREAKLKLPSWLRFSCSYKFASESKVLGDAVTEKNTRSYALQSLHKRYCCTQHDDDDDVVAHTAMGDVTALACVLRYADKELSEGCLAMELARISRPASDGVFPAVPRRGDSGGVGAKPPPKKKKKKSEGKGKGNVVAGGGGVMA